MKYLEQAIPSNHSTMIIRGIDRRYFLLSVYTEK